MRRRSAAVSTNAEKSTAQQQQLSEVFRLPRKYDKRWRLNFVYKPNRKTTLSAYDAFGNKVRTECTDEQLQEFEFIMHIYLDFCQKEKVTIY